MASPSPAAALAEVLAPWRAALDTLVPDLVRFDAHTHVGEHDPDGFTQSMEELVERLERTGTAGCFVFPFHEPDGYPGPNDAVREGALAASARPGAPRLVPFCRVDPRRDPVAEAERCLDLGARGIKLHPRAERFELDHPAVRSLVALAHERRLPVLVHSGRGIEAPGVHLLELARDFPGARIILAHAGATDLAWLWRAAPEVPNLLFDTSWWIPTDLRVLFALVPPGQVLFASDAPYGDPLVGAITQVRLMLAAGWSPAQIRLACAGQSLAVAEGAPLSVAGPALGEGEPAPHLLLDRVAAFIQMAVILWIRGGDGSESLALARQAAALPEDHDDAPVSRAILGLLDAFATLPEGRERFVLLLLAGCVALTPEVALPAG